MAALQPGRRAHPPGRPHLHVATIRKLKYDTNLLLAVLGLQNIP
jgi:hypothetical protein